MPTPFAGFAAMRAGLTHDTHIEACKIVKDKQNFKELMLSDEMLQKCMELRGGVRSDEELF
jgi:hypothetical protein